MAKGAAVNSEELLTQAMCEVVGKKFRSEVGYLRLPQLVTAMPLRSVVDTLIQEFPQLRVADLTSTLDESEGVTCRVTQAIQWRNDGKTPILIVGDLHRNRAHGLANISTVSTDDVRNSLFDSLAATEARDVSDHVVDLLNALRGRNIPLEFVADYCLALTPLQPGSGDYSRAQLWKLGLLPDQRTAQKITAARLQLNEQTVDEIRTADPVTLQRFIANSTPEYVKLREFGRSGRRELLQGLILDDVIAAMRAAQVRPATQGDDGEPIEEQQPDILDLIADQQVAEEDLLEALRDHSGNGPLEVNGEAIEWDVPSTEQILNDPTLGGAEPSNDTGVEGTLFEPYSYTDPDTDWHTDFYRSKAGGMTASFGTATEWHPIADIRQQLADLADDAPAAGRRALDAFDRLVDGRGELAPYAKGFTAQGVRLFLASDTLRSQADELIRAWEDLWDALKDMRSELPRELATYVKRMADSLTLVDVVVEKDSAGIRARLLPTHPVVLEPRVRAAKMFREMQSDEQLDREFIDTVSANLDPAAPSLGIVVGKNPEALAFSGVSTSGEPVYGERRLASGTPETTQILRQVIDRFLVAHPYAQLSLSVILVEPTPAVARRLLDQLQDPRSCSAERIVLRVFSAHGVSEMRTQLASVAGAHDERSRVVVEVHDGSPDEEALRVGGAPHLAFLFDVSDGGTPGFGSLLESEQQGSVVTEWLFVSYNRTTVIKPSASGRLAALLNRQGELASAEPAELDRSPLLSGDESARLWALGQTASWLVLVESTSALAAPEYIDAPNTEPNGQVDGEPEDTARLHLVGRIGSGAHTAYVYCRELQLLVEPPLRTMQGNSWLDPEPESLLTFLANTVRRALPEGLLSFFGAKKPLGDDAILGKIGVAAVLAELQKDEDSLVMSLDTDAARKWLQRRKSNRRADLLQLRWTDEGPCVKVIEVKSTRDPLEDGNIPSHVYEASEQVLDMMEVLSSVFQGEGKDRFAASRREILKRQVFLEALQQWEETRVTNWAEYKKRLDRLNRLFRLDGDSPSVIVEGEVVLVGIDAPQTDYPEQIGPAGLPLKVLGGDWLRSALRHGRDHAIVPASLGDLLPALAEEFSSKRQSAEQDVLSPMADGCDESVTVADDGIQTAGESPQRADRDFIGGQEQNELARQVVGALRARSVPLRRLEESDITAGPSVLRVPFELEPGARLSVLANQEMDLARDLGVPSIRVDNLPGRARYAVLEIPRSQRVIADVSELELPQGFSVSVALGTDYEFQPFWVPLQELPHLLIGGTTGSGKSTMLRSVLWQLTRLYPPDALDLILIDAKGMGDFRDLARAPQIRESSDYHLGADGALDLLGDVVERRLPERVETFNLYADAALSRTEPKNITDVVALAEDAAQRGEPSPLRPLIIVIDEFSEIALSTSDRRRFETLVTRFVQRARAVGGHLIAATQRPSVDVVPGVMKANFARLSLMVRSAMDSRVVLDAAGAERLLPKGDMLYASSDQGLVRLQGFAAQGPYPPVNL